MTIASVQVVNSGTVQGGGKLNGCTTVQISTYISF